MPIIWEAQSNMVDVSTLALLVPRFSQTKLTEVCLHNGYQLLVRLTSCENLCVCVIPTKRLTITGNRFLIFVFI